MLSLALAGLLASTASLEPTASTATLEMQQRLLDFEGNKKKGLMYMPGSAKLADEKPAAVKKEPTYRGTPRYATIKLGNTDKNEYVLAFDEPKDQEPRVYLDLNADGDLTNDGDGAWHTTTPGKEGAAPQLSGTWVFDIAWKAGADGKPAKGKYGLNFYRSPDRDAINFYRASARTGTIKIAGKDYEVMLIDNDNDGVYNKLFDPAAPTVVGAPMSKPVWLSLDGGRYDIRGTFGFGDLNYLATVSDDGAKLTMTPTMKIINIPRPTERPAILGVGKEVPEFEAMLWKDGAEKPFKMSDYKGKIMVVDMWATWCGPCMSSLPHLSKLAAAVKDQGVVVMALNVFDDKGAYDRFVTENKGKYAFDIARDPAGREKGASIAGRLFNISAIPVTYVIGKDGKIVAAISGFTQGDTQVEAALKGLGVKVE